MASPWILELKRSIVAVAERHSAKNIDSQRAEFIQGFFRPSKWLWPGQ